MNIGLQGLLGKIPFSCSDSRVLTFQKLQVQKSARYASHDIIGQKPVNEYVGPSMTTLSFTIQLRAQLGSHPLVYINMLQDILDSGEAQRLILGSEYFGKYVLESYSEDRKIYTGLGVCVGADVSVSLREAAAFNMTSFLKTQLATIGL